MSAKRKTTLWSNISHFFSLNPHSITLRGNMNGHEIKVPPLGESIVEATLASWHKKVGDKVAQDDCVFELETDKVTLEITAPVAGVIAEQVVAAGETVRVGDVIARLTPDVLSAVEPVSGSVTENVSTDASIVNDSGATVSAGAAALSQSPLAEQKTVASTNVSSVSSTASSASSKPPLQGVDLIMSASPSVRKRLAERGLTLSDVAAVTRLDGRVTQQDIARWDEQQTMATTASKESFPPSDGATEQTAIATAVSSTEPTTDISYSSDLDRRERRVPMTRLRQRIGERLKQAQNTAAMKLIC